MNTSIISTKISTFNNKMKKQFWKRRSMQVSLLSAFLLVGILLSLQMSEFVLQGYVPIDSYAIQNEEIAELLADGDTSSVIDLLYIEHGTEYFSQLLNKDTLYLGDEKTEFYTGYPMFDASGQLLYFLDDQGTMITNEWEKLSSYSGLYLSDGTTFNENLMQADIDTVLMVQVTGGYQLAQDTVLFNNAVEYEIPMNAIVVFSEDTINYYAFLDGALVGETISVPTSAYISIGADTYLYIDFLERLGLWEDTESGIIQKADDVVEDVEEDEDGDKDTTVEVVGDNTSSTTSLEVTTEEITDADIAENAEVAEKAEKVDKVKVSVSQTAKENANAEPEAAKDPESKNPDYVEPIIEMGQLRDPWVYTATSDAVVEDPASVLKSGVQIYIYEVTDEGETLYMRYGVFSTKELIISTLKPSTTYKAEAVYEYSNINGITVEGSIDMGEITTLSLDELEPVKIGFYDYLTVPAGETDVEIFEEQMQLRNFEFSNVSNGTTVDMGASASLIYASQMTETYVTDLDFIMASGTSTSVVEIDSSSLRLLRAGYTMSYWNSDEDLRTAREYTFTIEISDKFGNSLPIEGLETGSAKTSAEAPGVVITVPADTNIAGSTQIDVKYDSNDGVIVESNTKSGSTMGSDISAGLFLVNYGDEIVAENAILLEAYREDDPDQTIVKSKFLPIESITDNTITSWVITNLEILNTYSAGVIAGYYDNDDNRDHRDEVIDSTISFLTASLSNLGRVSYTISAGDITYNTAEITFKMNSVDERLLPLLSEIDLYIESSTTEMDIEYFALEKDVLDDIDMTLTLDDSTEYYTGSVTIPMYINGTDEIYETTISYSGLTSTESANVWDIITGTATSDNNGSSNVTIMIGEEFLESTQSYTAYFQTKAAQASIEEDVSAQKPKTVNFNTLSQEAQMLMDNAFVSTNFIELYGVSFQDFDECIQEDTADRGGYNVYLQILNENGVQVQTYQLNSEEIYDVIRIEGLDVDVTYTMKIVAYRYTTGTNTVEANYALSYFTPQDEANPYEYIFTTGESVVGDVSLLGVSQLYEDEDGNAVSEISMLTEDDFYFGIWQNTSTLYYKDEATLDEYYEKASEIEDAAVMDYINGVQASNNRSIYQTSDKYTDTAQTTIEAAFTSKLIEVEVGDYYFTSNGQSLSYYRVNFFYMDSDGVLKYYKYYTSDDYKRGGVFEVTTVGTTDPEDRVYYMQISACTTSYFDNMVVGQYEPEQAETYTNLAEGVDFVTGMYLSSSNTYTVSENYAYTEDYIPVTTGSLYVFGGRNSYYPDEDGMTGTTAGSQYVLFYDSSYNFIGSYYVSSQTAFVKAPFGAAYCRFNVRAEIDDDGIASVNMTDLFMKEYISSEEGEYIVTLQTDLSDASVEQILTNGSYTIALYDTANTLAETDDLEEQTYNILTEELYEVESSDFVDGLLNISEILEITGLESNKGYKVELIIHPEGWDDTSIILDTLYFSTHRVVYTISNLEELKSISNDPAGSYIVSADIEGVTRVLSSDRPFTGTIDFQGHTITMTTFDSLFYRISGTGVVKNLDLVYEPVIESTTAYSSRAALAYLNYGTIQDVLLTYGPSNTSYGIDITASGGLVAYNYGSIDGFVIEISKDVYVGYYFGVICRYNKGDISNGYVYAAEITAEDGTVRDAQLIHPYYDRDTLEVINTSVHTVAVGVGENDYQGSIENVFILSDLVVESASAINDRNNADYSTDNTYYETSTTYTYLAGILVGNNYGSVDGAFTVGDRYDSDIKTGDVSYMIDRGPAIAYVQGLYSVENLTYFSYSPDAYSQFTNTVATISDYNKQGTMESLYDYQWYEDALGEDGENFEIRSQIELGYYPRLTLSSYFAYDDQPSLELPKVYSNTAEIQSNEVRVQGTNEVLATVTMTFPAAEYGAVLSNMSVYASNNVEISCEIVAQQLVGDDYRVDILLSIPENSAAFMGDEYVITSVTWATGSQTFTDNIDARTISAAFYREISSIDDWKTNIATDSPPYGADENYRLTADIDFTESTTYKDWYSTTFDGVLDGAKYNIEEIVITDTLGNTVYDEDGVARTIEQETSIASMYTISGVGNVDATGTVTNDRDNTYSASLSYNMKGTVKNVIFSNFVSATDKSYDSTVNSAYVGVYAYASSGAVFDNVHVRDSVFYGKQEVGALAGRAYETTIMNSSVKDTSVAIYRQSDSIIITAMVGGIAGRLERSSTMNCFVADVSVKASDVAYSSGIGGLYGYINVSQVENCYATGDVAGECNYVGGIGGWMTDDSTLTGCWSTANVTTSSDYAGGILGYHAAGTLTNNYTASTVLTKSMTTNYVHRITSKTTYDEVIRYNNYVFEGQYLTYFDTSSGSGLYLFGKWDQLDGATALLSESELLQPATWDGIINIGDGFDLYGTAASGGMSGGTSVTTISSGYMPKLTYLGTDTLLYDQPDEPIGSTSESYIDVSKVAKETSGEILSVEMVVYKEGVDLTGDFDAIADWANISITGAVVLNQTEDDTTGGITDEGSYNSGEGYVGRKVSFQIGYGDSGGDQGSYLDTYMLVLQMKDEDGGLDEIIQTRIQTEEPIYKNIYSISDWNSFFSNSKYSGTYQNVAIRWASAANGIIDFTENITETTTNVYNVKVNRLTGEYHDTVLTSIENIDIEFTTASQSLISQVITGVEDISFKNCTLTSTNGGNYKGIIGYMMGNMDNVTFDNIEIVGGTSSYVGMIGYLDGDISNVTMTDISVETVNDYVGGLAGYSTVTSSINNITLTASDNSRNMVKSYEGAYVGGLVGNMIGSASDVSVTDLDIYSRTHAGGIAGAISSTSEDASIPKLQNAVVGDSTQTSTTPGVLDVDNPSVSVTLCFEDGYGTEENTTSAGGAVGSATNAWLQDIEVYNTLVSIPDESPTDALKDGTHAYYAGGIVGYYGSKLYDSIAQNCTVYTAGGYCGGLSGLYGGNSNTVLSCVVYATKDYATRVGGAIGSGSSVLNTVQNTVVSGANYVGGAIGYGECDYTTVVDTLVFGEDNVGGIGGSDNSYAPYYNNVTTSTDPQEITITEDMISPLLQREQVGKTYSGTRIEGNNNVGGLFGVSVAPLKDYNIVGTGVEIIGNDSVGGLIGLHYGVYSGNYSTTVRSIRYSIMAGNVTGATNVGGIIGNYTTETSMTGSSVVTAIAPTPTYFWSLLVTGNVTSTGDDSANFLMPGVEFNGELFQYCRVYEDATLTKSDDEGVLASTLGMSTFNSLQGEPAVDAGSKDADFYDILTVTAENLNDENLYIGNSGTTYGDFGWNTTIFDTSAIITMFKPVTTPVDFDTYEEGIEQDNLVLWLDAKNNTGNGYTDEDATVWKDLSDSGNDAVLHWNYKSTDSTITIAEMNSYNMRWNDGALEFPRGSAGYYAELEESISGYLQDGYTVEIIYEYMDPDYAYTSYTSTFSWIDGTNKGGFYAPYNNIYELAYLRYDVNLYISMSEKTANTEYKTDNDISSLFYRTSSYVVDEKDSTYTVSYYANGELYGLSSTTSGDPDFIESDTLYWRIGQGPYTNANSRIQGIRVYSDTLTEAEVLQNQAYDMWYYYGDETQLKSEQLTSLNTSVSLSADGTYSGGTAPYTLVRSTDGSYNGTLVMIEYDGIPLETRGYYYLVDANGNYSNVVTVDMANYGVTLNYISQGEYWSQQPYDHWQGQEGLYVDVDADADGTSAIYAYDVDDNMYNGGIILPESSYSTRDGGFWADLAANTLSLMSGFFADDFIDVNVYASGVDLINIELSEDPGDSLYYEIEVDGSIVEEGSWDSESCTMTMTWDYSTDFTLTLRNSTDVLSWDFASEDVVNTVMTYGTGYWYLCSGICYDMNNDSISDNATFIHMYNGYVLDSNGNIWDVASEAITDTITSFQVQTDPTPIWSGTINGIEVESFATYSMASTGMKYTQMMVKDDVVYTLPATGEGIGSFIIDTYSGSIYETTLISNGSLTDWEEELVYPEDFANGSIAETSNNLYASSHIILVRYESGQLVAFNYLTGDVYDVYSDVLETVSLASFAMNSIQTMSSNFSFFSTDSSSGTETTASDIQELVDGDAALENALASVTTSGEGITDGTASGVNEATELAAADTGNTDSEFIEAEPLEDEITEIEETEIETSNEQGIEAMDEDEISTEASEEGVEGETSLTLPAEAIEADYTESDLESASSSTPSPASEDTTVVEIVEATEDVSTSYIGVYNTETGETDIYNLDEYLMLSEVEVLTVQEKLDVLEENGFETTLIIKTTTKDKSIGGLVLLVLVSFSALGLIIYMDRMKRRKFDKEQEGS
ncbi:MAG: hypothetical protein R3Y47_10930 [Lachnospiraceae bacterium]